MKTENIQTHCGRSDKKKFCFTLDV